MRIDILSGTAVAVRGNEIDTDRIIPARYMKVVTFDGLGQYAFQDERFDAEGNRRTHPFNDEKYTSASVLLVNKNFGCGSSREHAPQALHRWGIKAIIGESFAEIFAGNCTSMGIPAVTTDSEEIEALMKAAEEDSSLRFEINLDSMKVSAEGISVDLNMPAASRAALLGGTWDSTASLLEGADLIEKKLGDLPYITGFS